MTEISRRRLVFRGAVCLLACWIAIAPPAAAQLPESQPPDTQAVEAEPAHADPSESPAAAPPAASAEQKPPASNVPQPSLPWLPDLAQAQVEASSRGTPILVRVGADFCPWCHKLEAEIELPEAQQELARWTLVALDADKAAQVVRRLGVGPIPALRVLSGRGKLVASHDGYLPAAELVAWLREHYDAALAAPPDVLVEETSVRADSLSAVVEQFGSQDPVLREAAIERLLPYQQLAAPAIVELFAEGRLGQRLAALEALSHWKAPLDDLDPWRPETLSQDRLDELRRWAGEPPALAAESTLSPEDLAAAEQEIVRFVEAEPAEAEAIAARLARAGPALLPQVYARLEQARTDDARQRLTWLRYRLVATEGLVLRWPGGLQRLADRDSKVRHQAAEELARFVSPSDGPLLLELFSDPDPLVRELSLKALSETGGERMKESLVRLLDDPEPNVRAAVLKQFTASPSQEIVPEIVRYLAREQDADLVVHAVRLLRATKGQAAINCLMTLLDHASWQVRAEAAEAIGECIESGYSASQSLQAKVYVAMIDLLDDEDGFVVSRAINALKEADLALAVEPLAKAAEKHPDLAGPAVTAMLGGDNMRFKAVTVLRTWLAHAEADLRAAALVGLCSVSDEQVEAGIRSLLADSSSKVRRTAAQQLFALYESERPSSDPDDADTMFIDDGDPFGAEMDSDDVSIWGAIKGLFGLSTTKGAQRPKMREPAGAEGEQETVEEPVEAEAVEEPVEAEVVEEPVEEAVATQSVGSPAGPPAPLEDWLAEFRSGKDRPAWMSDLVTPLEAMLAAEAADERLAAAMALIPLGKDEPALGVLQKTVDENPKLLIEAAEILAWLPWEQRLPLFERMAAASTQSEQLTALAGGLAVLPDLRAAPPLWNLLASDAVTAGMAQHLVEHLSRVYGASDGYSESPSPGRLDFAQVKRQAVEGRHWQRVVALALLYPHDKPATAEAAAQTFDDPAAAGPLRLDALQFLLLSLPEPEAKSKALAVLAGGDEAARKMALAFLALGQTGIAFLHGSEFQPPVQYTAVMFGMDGAPYQPPSVPEGLDLDLTRRLAGGDDAEAAAYAGYLLALAGHGDGLDKLVAVWRENRNQAHLWNPLVYQAVAALDDAGRVPLLEEIYESMRGSYDVRNFYWSIRAMHGAEILKLRKRIRDEVGMEMLK
ncbi:MAG: HEAT repeat domain-containing protein [Pirellulales bacterium]